MIFMILSNKIHEFIRYITKRKNKLKDYGN
jgi:hypothetical protein